MTTSRSYSTKRSNPVLAIFVGGLLGGIGDITFAFVYYRIRYGTTVVQVLHSVASGLVGREASNSGGVKTAVLGLFCHFAIAFIWATVYFLASRVLKFMVRYAVVCGLLYGIIIYVFMNWVVLPMSALHSRRPPLVDIHQVISIHTIPLIGHMILIGLPIALSVRRFAK
jgi:hypothetical protein